MPSEFIRHGWGLRPVEAAPAPDPQLPKPPALALVPEAPEPPQDEEETPDAPAAEPELEEAAAAEFPAPTHGAVMIQRQEQILLNERQTVRDLIHAEYERRVTIYIGTPDERAALYRLDNDDELRALKLAWLEAMVATRDAKLAEADELTDVEIARYKSAALDLVGWPNRVEAAA